MGVTKTRRVFVRVTDGQHEGMRTKAEEYGVTLSRLVLVAVEAYSRTHEAWTADGQPVAVSYGVWTTVDDKLHGTEEALRDVARQLGGVRRALRGTAPDDATLAAVMSCQADIARMLADVERCTRVLDHVRDAAHLVDPYLGPMEDRRAQGGGASEGGE